MYDEKHVTISPVLGGFLLTYPVYVGSSDEIIRVAEVVTTVGKAMRIAKHAVEMFSLVTKSKEDEAV